MLLSLGQAAKHTGKSKPTINNALKKGHITGNKNARGIWEIDVSELDRFYPPNTLNGKSNAKIDDHETPQDNGLDVGLYESKIKALEDQLNLTQEHMAEKDARIADLRADKAVLTGLLTDQRPPERKKIFGIF